MRLEKKPEGLIPNLGQIIGRFTKMRDDHAEEDYMNSLMDGSGECSHFWLESQEREEARLIAQVEAETGLSIGQLFDQAKARTSWKWSYNSLNF